MNVQRRFYFDYSYEEYFTEGEDGPVMCQEWSYYYRDSSSADVVKKTTHVEKAEYALINDNL